MPHKPKASLQTLGCRLNQAESEMIAQSLQNCGYEIVSHNETADVCIVNTCTVTGHSDAKNRQMIRGIHRKFPNAAIAVIGCYAQMSPKDISQNLIPGAQMIPTLCTSTSHPTKASQLPYRTQI